VAFAGSGDSEQLAVGIAGHQDAPQKSAKTIRAPVYAGCPSSSSF
jgi:hypothetical protein